MSCFFLVVHSTGVMTLSYIMCVIQPQPCDPVHPPTMVELQEATVYWDAAQKSVVLKEGVMETEGGAYGYFNDTLLLSGWGVLEILAGHGGITQEDETTFFLAGYLEGYLTAG